MRAAPFNGSSALLFATGFAIALAGCDRSRPAADLPLLASVPISANDSADGVIKKAIQNHGGRAAFERWKCGRLRCQMMADIADRKLPAEIVDSFDFPDSLKREIHYQDGAATGTLTWCASNGASWSKGANDAKAAPSKMPWTPRQVHEIASSFDIPKLTERSSYIEDFGQNPAGERVIRVDAGKGLDAELCFSKQGLLAKVKWPTPDSRADNPSYFMSEYNDYRRIQGGMVPFRLKSTKGGESVFDITLIEVTFFDILDPKTFAMP